MAAHACDVTSFPAKTVASMKLGPAGHIQAVSSPHKGHGSFERGTPTFSVSSHSSELLRCHVCSKLLATRAQLDEHESFCQQYARIDVQPMVTSSGGSHVSLMEAFQGDWTYRPVQTDPAQSIGSQADTMIAQAIVTQHGAAAGSDEDSAFDPRSLSSHHSDDYIMERNTSPSSQGFSSPSMMMGNDSLPSSPESQLDAEDVRQVEELQSVLSNLDISVRLGIMDSLRRLARASAASQSGDFQRPPRLSVPPMGAPFSDSSIAADPMLSPTTKMRQDTIDASVIELLYSSNRPPSPPMPVPKRSNRSKMLLQTQEHSSSSSDSAPSSLSFSSTIPMFGSRSSSAFDVSAFGVNGINVMSEHSGLDMAVLPHVILSPTYGSANDSDGVSNRKLSIAGDEAKSSSSFFNESLGLDLHMEMDSSSLNIDNSEFSTQDPFWGARPQEDLHLDVSDFKL